MSKLLLPTMLIIGSCATMGAVPSAQATTYYVSPCPSPTCSDSNPGTSLSAPWQTVNHAFNNIHAGDTVYFRGGVYPATCTAPCYNQMLEASGTSTSPITITNYPGEIAIIQGDTLVGHWDTPPFNSYPCVSNSTCVAYVVFQGTPTVGSGLVFEGREGSSTDGTEDVVDVEGSHDVTFDHVEIRNGDYHAGFYEYYGYNVKLTNSYIHDNGSGPLANRNTNNGVYWDTTNGTGNLIANNIIENNYAQGLTLYSNPSNVTVEENTVVNNGNYGIQIYGSSNAIVNNVAWNNGIQVGNGNSGSGNPQMVIVQGTNHTIDTNILWCSGSTNCNSGSSGKGYTDDTSQVVTNVINSDPQFIDSTDHNYRLKCGSPAFTTQNSAYVQSTDKDGVSRSSTSALGAYVY